MQEQHVYSLQQFYIAFKFSMISALRTPNVYMSARIEKFSAFNNLYRYIAPNTLHSNTFNSIQCKQKYRAEA